jgi:hypothetical protein
MRRWWAFCILHRILSHNITLSNHSPHGVIRPRRILVLTGVLVHFFITLSALTTSQHHLSSAWHLQITKGRLESSEDSRNQHFCIGTTYPWRSWSRSELEQSSGLSTRVIRMQEAEEQGILHFCCSWIGFQLELTFHLLDTCRICSAPSDSDQPLFYPCKCSGTIRYIHQDWSVNPKRTMVLSYNLTQTFYLVWQHGYHTARRRPVMSANIRTPLQKVNASSFDVRNWLTLPPLVYAADMPSTLPPLLLFRRLAQQALFAVLFGLRAIMVGTVWLAVLPWITIWTWRVYFTMGEST